MRQQVVRLLLHSRQGHVQAMIADDSNAVLCYQCGWAMKRGEPYTTIVRLYPGCGNIEPVGVAHQLICVMGIALHESRVTTQHRRLVALRVN